MAQKSRENMQKEQKQEGYATHLALLGRIKRGRKYVRIQAIQYDQIRKAGNKIKNHLLKYSVQTFDTYIHHAKQFPKDNQEESQKKSDGENFLNPDVCAPKKSIRISLQSSSHLLIDKSEE